MIKQLKAFFRGFPKPVTEPPQQPLRRLKFRRREWIECSPNVWLVEADDANAIMDDARTQYPSAKRIDVQAFGHSYFKVFVNRR